MKLTLTHLSNIKAIESSNVLVRARIKNQELRLIQADAIFFSDSLFTSISNTPYAGQCAFSETVGILEEFQKAGLHAPDGTVSIQFRHKSWIIEAHVFVNDEKDNYKGARVLFFDFPKN